MSKKFSIVEKIYQDLLLLSANDEFMKEVERLRSKCKKPVAKTDNLDIFYDDTTDYQKDIKKLRDKFNLSQQHHLSLGVFCRSKKKMPKLENVPRKLTPKKLLCLNPGILDILAENNEKISVKDVYEMADEKVVLEIYPETTSKDVAKVWSEIAKNKKQLFGNQTKKKVRRKNIERDLYIWKLKKQGLSNRKIMEKVNHNKKYNQTIIGYNDVSKILKRLKPPKES